MCTVSVKAWPNNGLTQHMMYGGSQLGVTGPLHHIMLCSVGSAVITRKSSNTELCTLQSEDDGMKQQKIG